MKMKTFLRSALALTLSAAMVVGTCMTTFAAKDDTFHYVSIGASNTNGYGMRGYITEEELNLLLSGQVSKDDVNVYGYERTPEGGYPDLIRDYYSEFYEEVVVNQLAISSMRVEELRILLDDTYNGDDYSTWRFTGDDGWFRSAEEGGIPALREAYKSKIQNADLLTVDIGWNNFGVYVCNQLVDYMSNGRVRWNTDINTIYDTAEEAAAAQEAKAIIGEYIKANVGEGEFADVLTDIFAYSILGYMHNFDICMEKVYELNPDLDVVVLGIQNLLDGAVVDIGGQKMLLGDIFGNFVNMANYYISAVSPHQAKYQYVKAGNNEHVTIFLDFMKSYEAFTGTAEELTQNGKVLVNNINQNVRDCFDYYDNDLFIQSTIDYIAAQQINAEYGDMLSLVEMTAEEAVALGKKGELPVASLQETFDAMYWPGLFAAYDTLCQLVCEIASLEYVDGNGLLSGTLDIGDVEDQLKDALSSEIQENALAAGAGDAYTVELEKILPNAEAEVVAAMYIRYYMGNSFFAHPNEDGHKEIKDAVLNVINNPETEKDQALKAELIESVKQIDKLISGAGNQEPQDTFTDVEKGRFYYDAVYWAVDKGITNGITATTFEPETACTRAQAVTFLYRLAGKPSVAGVKNPFTDLDPKAFYYDAVLWAVNAGITNGMTATTFEPQTTCTRGQIVTFIWRASGKEAATATTHPFTDVKEGAYYYDAMLWAVENGITNGMTDTTFAPANECTRGQIVTFLYRGFAE